MMELGKVGLALGGGGAKGFAHIGVIKALEEHQFKISKVSGTSMGAIVGVLYAAGYSSDDMLNFLQEEKVWNWFKIDLLKGGLVNLKGAKEALMKYIGHDDFARLKKPFYVTASNLNNGRIKVVSEGKQLFDWVIASSSVPVAFTPQEINNNIYVDGGLFMNLPSEPLMFDCDMVIGSSVIADKRVEKVKNAKDVAERVFNLSIIQNERISKLHCDYCFEIKKLNKYSMWDFHKFDEIVEIGYSIAKKKMQNDLLPQIAE
ncbi:MAG: patatin-like phospholipase family protein [Carboxylicivirga sp.]|jgi:NTE family protein|nr:patatin-like phospholipase family protein [Carboxylicivirga sp.]